MSRGFLLREHFEDAILDSPSPLTAIEIKMLAKRYGLFPKKNFPPMNGTDFFEKDELIDQALTKCLHEQIRRLIEESDRRVKRYFKYGEKEGKADLELACNMLKKADFLNDCRIAYCIPCK